MKESLMKWRWLYGASLAFACAPSMAHAQSRSDMNTFNNLNFTANGQRQITGPIGHGMNQQIINGVGVLGDTNIWTGSNNFTGALSPTKLLSNGTNVYPTYNSARLDYSSTSSVLTNTIGAANGLFGYASKSQLYWPNTYMPGMASPGQQTVLSIAVTGRNAGYFATRASDYTGTAARSVSVATLCVHDSTGISPQPSSQNLQCTYQQMNIVNGADWGNGVMMEMSIGDADVNALSFDPYTGSIGPHIAENLRLDSGIGGSYGTASDAISILNNGGNYIRGVVCHNGAFDTTTNATPDCLSMASNQSIGWFAGVGNEIWKLYSDATDLQVVGTTAGAFDVTSAGGIQLHLFDSNLVSGQYLGIGINSIGVSIIDGPQGLSFYTGGNPGTVRHNITAAGIFNFQSPVADSSWITQSATTSYTIAVGVGGVYIDSGGGVFALTAPAAPIDGQKFGWSCSKAFTTFSVLANASQTLLATPSTCAIGGHGRYQYKLASTTWYAVSE